MVCKGKIGITLLILLALASPAVFAGGQEEEQIEEKVEEPAPVQESRIERLATPGEEREAWAVRRVSALIGAPVESLSGKTLGELANLALDVSSGDLRYYLFSLDEDQGYRSRLYPIPHRVLRFDTDNEVFVMRPEHVELLRNAPTFTGPPEEGGSYIRHMNYATYWNTYAGEAVATQGPVRGERRSYYWYRGARVFPGSMMLYSEISDLPVQDEEGTLLGRMEDMVIDMDGTSAMYLITRPGNNGSLVPAPLGAYVMDIEREAVILAVTEEELAQAPGYYVGAEPELRTDEWRRRIADYWVVTETEVAVRTGMRVIPRSLQRASQIIGLAVLNTDGSGLGRIADLVVTRAGKVPYAAVEFDEVLGLGGQWRYIPMGAFSIDELNLLAYADIPQRILNLLPSFDENELPDTRYPEWDREIRAYWLESERTAGELMEATIAKIFEEERRQRADDPGAMLAERLLDYRVINPEGEDLGGVEDLMIHLETLEVVYPIITFGGFLGFGEKRFPVPVDMVEVVPPQEALVLNVDVTLFEEAPGFGSRDWPESADPFWSRITEE